jgi:hypothetical protein
MIRIRARLQPRLQEKKGDAASAVVGCPISRAVFAREVGLLTCDQLRSLNTAVKDSPLWKRSRCEGAAIVEELCRGATVEERRFSAA